MSSCSLADCASLSSFSSSSGDFIVYQNESTPSGAEAQMSSTLTIVFSERFRVGSSLNRYPLNVNKRCISLIFPRSSFHLDSAQMPSFQLWMRSNIRDMTGPGNAGGRSGNRRTSSFKNSLVAIWRCSGYPHDWTSVSRRAKARMAMWGFL